MDAVGENRSPLNKYIFLIIGLNLIFLNGLLLWFIFLSNQRVEELVKPAEIALLEPEDLSSEADSELEDLKKDLKTLEATLAAQLTCPASPELNYTPIAPPPTKTLTHKLEEIKFLGARGTNSTAWWDIPNMEATFNAASYPNNTAYWEALLRVKDGAGEAWARIYDTNAGIPIVGSEIKTSSGVLVRVSSGSIKFWPEERTYRIQIKSLLGPEAVVEDAKIKISWIKEE